MHPLLRSVVIAAIVTAGVRSVVHGQNAEQKPPAFEIASVKRAAGSGPGIGSGIRPTPGRFVAQNVPAQMLIGVAYRDDVDDIAGVPAWARSEYYTVTATLPPDVSPVQTPLMLRNLLVERFQLVAHVERHSISRP